MVEILVVKERQGVLVEVLVPIVAVTGAAAGGARGTGRLAVGIIT